MYGRSVNDIDYTRHYIAICLHVGISSPPGLLEATRQDNKSSVTLQWSRPTYTGNKFPIQKYRITIPGTNYSEEVETGIVCNGSQCSHSLTTDGRDVEFNRTYLVELTAVNTCDLESSPEILNVEVIAFGEFIKRTLSVYSNL